MKSAILLGFDLVMFAVQVSATTTNDCKTPFFIGRDATDCSKWFKCVFGIPYPMVDCAKGTLFSLQAVRCVPKGSNYDDCPLGRTSPANRCDVSSPNTVFSKDDNCAQFYNCSLTPIHPGPGYLGDYVDECPYPELFSETTNKCENFENVTCGRRREIVYACHYARLHCPVKFCKPCASRYPDCRGLPDGIQAWKNMYRTPYYAECYKGRGYRRTCLGIYEHFIPEKNRCEIAFPPN